MSYLEDFFDRRKAARQMSPEERAKQNQKNLEDQRQRALDYKKFFGEDHGRSVMLDVMNKFYLSTPDTESPIVLARAAGRREVVEYLLGRAHVTMEQLDRILKGEFV